MADVKKMPLGKLSKTQIAKGFEVLEEIEDVLGTKPKPNKKRLEALCSQVWPVVFFFKINFIYIKVICQ